jgi:hypothetical protein
VVGTDAEQERCARVVPMQHLEQARHAIAGAAQRIDIDLEREKH